eukprot:7734667-Ditylum_brightwellii.AAC.1
MATNFVCHEIYKQAVNPLCHLCGKHNETIAHIASRCDMLRGTKMKDDWLSPNGSNTRQKKHPPSALARDAL